MKQTPSALRSCSNEQFKTQGSLVLVDKNRVSGLKQRKPTSPSMRSTCLTDRSMLWKGKPVKQLCIRITRKGGRNHSGKITIRHRGGGGVRKYRMVDFKRTILDTQGLVERLEYDPFRRAHLALISYPSDGSPSTPHVLATKTRRLQYILAPQNLKKGDTVCASRINLVLL